MRIHLLSIGTPTRAALRAGLCAAAIGCGTTPPADDSVPEPAPASRLVVTCCGGTDSLIMDQMQRYESTPEAQRAPEVAVLPYRMTSGLTRRDRIVVRDAAVWPGLWREVVGSHSPVPAPPAVDFARETIAVASMGQRNSGGYSISIDSAGMAGDTVILAVTERSPGPTCGTTAALSSPVALARILRANATVRFVERTAVTDCG